MKQSLVFDLQEPFRWIADVTVVEAFESRMLDLPDFYFTGDDYRYRFELEAKQRFLDLLRERFNFVVKYNGRALKWDTVIEQKTVELGRYVTNRSATLDLSEPSPDLCRMDDNYFRGRILALFQSEAKNLGIGKSTLHFLCAKASQERSFRLYLKVRQKLQNSASVPVQRMC